MARRSYSSRYSRSSRRRSGGGRSRRYGGKKRSRYTTKRRAGRAGVLAEVKFVNNIANRSWPMGNGATPTWTSIDIGATSVAWRPLAEEAGTYIGMQNGKDLGATGGVALDNTRHALTSRSYLLTHCAQGFEASRRVGLAINPRSFLLRAVVTAGRTAQLTANAAGHNDAEVSGKPGNLLGDGQQIGATHVSSFVRTALRIVVFRDMEPPLTAESASEEPRKWTDLFSTSTNGSTTDFLRTDNIGRFAVVTDTTVDLDSDDPQKSIQLRIPIAKTLRYGGAAANQIRAGHYFMVCCAEMLNYNGSNPDATFMPPTIAYQHRMAFTDS